GRRLAAAGRAGDQDQAARQLDQVGDRRRQAELVHLRRGVRNDAEDTADSTPLDEQVAAEAGQALHAEGEVELALLLELLLLLLGEDAVAERLGVVRQELLEGQRLYVTVHAHHRRRTGGDVQVGRTGVRHLLKQLVDLDRHESPLCLRTPK